MFKGQMTCFITSEDSLMDLCRWFSAIKWGM